MSEWQKLSEFHEDIARLDSGIEAGFQAFSRKVDELREEMSQSIDGQDKDLKEWTRGKLTHVNTQLRGLGEVATAVEKFVHQKFSPQQSGASAPESSPSQGHVGTAASNRIMHATSSTAASSSAARAPTPTHDHGPVERELFV